MFVEVTYIFNNNSNYIFVIVVLDEDKLHIPHIPANNKLLQRQYTID